MMKFKPLDIEDYQTLKPYFDKQSYRLSVYSLLSLIVWARQKYIAGYIIEKDAVVIGCDSISDAQDRYLVLPVKMDADYTPEYLHELSCKFDYPRYCFVPGDYLERYARERWNAFFSIEEQPEYDDYIYLTEDLANLKGNRFSGKRNLIHQLFKLYPEEERISVEKITSENARDCLLFLEEWCKLRNGCDGPQDESLACEYRAVKIALGNIEVLEGMGILVRLDGVVNAFGIASPVTVEMGVLNFEKAFSHIRGLYQFLDNECAKRLFANHRFLNKESDMNIPELAQSKKSYHPIERLKSYCLLRK